MREQLSIYWRTAVGVLGWAIFILGAAIFRLICVPLLYLFPAEQRIVLTRLAIGRLTALFFWFMQILGYLKVHMQGQLVRREGATIIVANHPTLIDALLLLTIFPRAEVIFKEGLRNIIGLRGICNAANYISNSASPSLVDTCVTRLLNGGSLIVFPEGTRSEGNQVGRFKGGAATIALRSKARVIPVVLRCDPPALQKDTPWYRVTDRTLTLSVTIGDPIAVADQIGTDERAGGRALTELLQRYFEDRVVYG